MEYKDLDVWIQARKLVKVVYNLSSKFPNDEKFGLTNQIRRCAVSIPSNIAEGCGRQHVNDSVQFFYISRGSLYELETQLYLSFDLEYINEQILNETLELLVKTKTILNGFINYFKKK